MQKAKTRTKIIYIPTSEHNGNGFHNEHNWAPGDPPEQHSLFGAIGTFKDDPFWDEFVQAMDDERHKIDKQYPI